MGGGSRSDWKPSVGLDDAALGRYEGDKGLREEELGAVDERKRQEEGGEGIGEEDQ